MAMPTHYRSKAELDRARGRVLRAIRMHGDRGAAVADVSRDTALPRSLVERLLRELAAGGVLEGRGERKGRRYVVAGPAAPRADAWRGEGEPGTVEPA